MMATTETTTVRLSTRTHQLLRDLARTERKTLQEILDDAAEALRREVFFRRLRDALEARSADEVADDRAEAAAWDATLTDGLAKE
jgi:hypothetical protein